MAKYYGMVQGNRGAASRIGSSSSGLMASAQSWNGSLITYVHDGDGDESVFDIEISNGSSAYGSRVFSGTLSELKEKLAK